MSQPINSPYLFPENWGTIKMAGYGKLPGVLVGIKGLSREHEWVVQKGIAMSGASTIWRGRKIIENIAIMLEAPEHNDFVGLDKMVRALVPRSKTTKPSTFGFEHPMFSLCDVQRASLRSYGIEPSAAGSWLFTLGLIEYSPLVLAKVGPADPAKLPGPPLPVTAIQKEKAALLKQAALLGG